MLQIKYYCFWFICFLGVLQTKEDYLKVLDCCGVVTGLQLTRILQSISYVLKLFPLRQKGLNIPTYEIRSTRRFCNSFRRNFWPLIRAHFPLTVYSFSRKQRSRIQVTMMPTFRLHLGCPRCPQQSSPQLPPNRISIGRVTTKS